MLPLSPPNLPYINNQQPHYLSCTSITPTRGRAVAAVSKIRDKIPLSWRGLLVFNYSTRFLSTRLFAIMISLWRLVLLSTESSIYYVTWWLGTSGNRDCKWASRNALKGGVEHRSQPFVPNWDSPNCESESATARTTSLLVELAGRAALCETNMRQSSREAAWDGFWWRCVTLPFITHRVRGGDDLQESAPQSRRTPSYDVRRRDW